jgi:hypothetical protein
MTKKPTAGGARKGAGRKRIGATMRYQILLTPAQHKAAKQNGAAWVRRLIDEAQSVSAI